MTTIKYSRQREAIKEYLSHTKEHPTADMVFMNIKNIYPNISLGTVYRNLNLLADMGEIIKINGQDGVVRFDSKSKPHYHFICDICGNVMDIEMEPIDHIIELANGHFKGKVEGHNTFFTGKCEECLQGSRAN